MVIGVSGDTGTLTSFRSLIMGANKTITLNATGGKILCNLYEGTSASSVIQLFPSTTAQIEIGNSASTAYIVCAQDLYMGGDNNIWSPNFTYANNFSGTAYANDIRMFEDQLGVIYLGNKLGTGAGIVIQDNASFSDNRVLTMSAIGGKILCNLLTGTATSSNIEIGETGDTGIIRTRRDLYIGSTPFTSNKGIYCNYFDVLDPANSIIFCATQTTGTISIQPSASGASGTIFIGNSLNPAGDTSSLFIYKNTSFSANKTLTMSSTGGIINVNTIRGSTTGSAISLFSTSTSTITLGNILGSGLTINNTTTFATGKDLLFSSTGRIRVDRIVGSTPLTSDINIGYTDPLYTAIIQLNQNVRVNRISASKIVLTDANKQLVSSSFTDTDFARLAADNTFSGSLNTFTNTLACNTISATSTTSTGSLFGNILGGIINIGGSLTGTMNIGNTSGGDLTINPSVVLSSNKNLTLQGTGIITAPEIRCPLYNSTNATTLLEIGKTNTTANIILGGSLSSGSISLGLIGMSGVIDLLANVNIGTSAVNKGLTCNYFQTFNAGDLTRFAATSTTGNIRIGENQSTGNIVLGHSTPASDSGGLTINKFTSIATGKSLTLSSTSNFISDNIRGTGLGTSTSIYPTTTTGSITIGTAQTSGNITLGNGTAASDSGTLTINKNTAIESTKKLTLQTIESSSTGTNFTFLGNHTGGLNIMTNNTGGVIQISRTAATSSIRLNNKFQMRTATNNAYFNTDTATTTGTLFQGTMANRYLTTTMYASAPTSQWTCYESDAAGEGSAFIQNGDTSAVINPGDQSVLWWLDEDQIVSLGTNTTYAWSGWKISTAGVFTTSSDRRLKRNITPIVETDILNKLSLLQIVSYKWKPPTAEREFKDGVPRRKYQEKHIGYIAQDVKDVFPDVVERENDDAYWTIKREDLSQYFHLGVQELIKRDKEKQAQIDDLTARLARLEQLLIPV
jgi:hypothetical protein